MHRLLHEELPQPQGMIACWREMFAIAREKNQHPIHEYVPTPPATAGSARTHLV